MDEEIKKLLEENNKLVQEIHAMTKRINRFVISSQIMGVIKILVIVVPLIWGYYFLSPLLKDVLGQYQAAIGAITNPAGLLDVGQNNPPAIDAKNLPPELLKFLNR